MQAQAQGKKAGFQTSYQEKDSKQKEDKEDSERSGFRTSIRKAKSGKVLCTSFR